MIRKAMLAVYLGLAAGAAAGELPLEPDDTLATAALPEAFRPPDEPCCPPPPEPGAVALTEAGPVEPSNEKMPPIEAPSDDGGLLEFARECAEMELVPLKSLHESDDRRMMVGVDFDGVVGLYVFTE